VETPSSFADHASKDLKRYNHETLIVYAMHFHRSQLSSSLLYPRDAVLR
jgi:hypothetical protein